MADKPEYLYRVRCDSNGKIVILRGKIAKITESLIWLADRSEVSRYRTRVRHFDGYAIVREAEGIVPSQRAAFSAERALKAYETECRDYVAELTKNALEWQMKALKAERIHESLSEELDEDEALKREGLLIDA